MKKISIITAVILSLTLLLSVFTGCSSKMPTASECMEKIGEKLKKDSFADGTALAGLLESAVRKGSVEIKLDGSLEAEGISVGDAAAKIYCSDGDCAVDAKLRLMEKDLDLNAYYVGKDMKIILGSSLLSSRYAIAVEDIPDLLGVSDDPYEDYDWDDYDWDDYDWDDYDWDDYDSDWDVEVAGDSGSSVLGALLKALTDGNSVLNTKLKTVYEKYEKIVREEIEANFTGTVEKEDGNYIVTYTIGLDGIEKIVSDLYAKIRIDADVKTLIEEFSGLVGADASEISEAFEDENAVSELFDDLKKNVRKIDISFTVTADKKYNLLTADLKVSLESKDEDEEEYSKASIRLSFDNSDAEKKVFSWKITPPEDAHIDSDDAKFLNGSITVKYTENSKEAVKGSVSVTIDENTLKFLSFSYEKESGKYKIDLDLSAVPDSDSLPFRTFTVKGTASVSETKAVFTLDVDALQIDGNPVSALLTDSGVSLDGMKLTVTILAKDTMPAAPTDYKNFADLTEDESMALMTELTQALGGLGPVG